MEFFKNTYQSSPADEAAAAETPAEPVTTEYPETEPTDTSKFAVTKITAGTGT